MAELKFGAAVDEILDERQRMYGPPDNNFADIAKGWSVIFGVPVTKSDVAMAMIWTKVCREQNEHQADNLYDIAGYAGAAARLTPEDFMAPPPEMTEHIRSTEHPKHEYVEEDGLSFCSYALGNDARCGQGQYNAIHRHDFTPNESGALCIFSVTPHATCDRYQSNSIHDAI